MSQKVTIDVEARFIDKVTNAANKADKALDKLDKKKPKVVIDADDSKAQDKIDETSKDAEALDKMKPVIDIDAKDNASSKIEKAESKARSLANRVYTAAIKVRDSDALTKIANIGAKAQSLASKTWTAAVRIKDLATAPLTKIKNTLFSIKSLVLAITAGMAAKQFVMNPISVADQYSSAKIGFQTLLGDSEGQQMMNDLDAFAKATPFKTTEVIASTQRMLAMGWDARDIITDMKTIGDAAAATGRGTEGLNRIVLALSQIRSKGKLSTEELNQLAEAGISAKRYLAEGLGYGSGDDAIMKLSKDLENGAIGSERAIQAILQGMKEYNGMMDKTANETVSGLASQISDAFEINVLRRWGQGLQDGARKGLGSVLNLLDTAEEGLIAIGDLLYDIGRSISNWGAGKLKEMVKTVQELTKSEEWKNADIGGKIKILWDGIVADPIKEWWNGGGKLKTAATMNKIGSWLGKTLTKVLLAIFGATDILDKEVGADVGANVAGSFLQGFLDNFDGGAITSAFAKAVGNVWGALPTWAKMLLGIIGIGKVAGGVQNMAGNLASLIGTGGENPTGLIGMLGTTGGTGQGTGILGFLSKIGMSYGGGANMASLMGATGMQAGTASAIVGGATVAGAAGGLYGLYTGGKGIYNIYQGVKNGDQLQQQTGAAQFGGAAGGAALGAIIGSVIPGIGTLIGAGLGAGLGAITGNWGAGKLREMDAAKKTMTELGIEANNSAEAAAELERRQTAAAEAIDEAFGDVSLTLQEVQDIINNMVFGKKAEELERFGTAANDAKSALSAFKTSSESLNKMNWKASLGYTFDDAGKEQYKTAVNQYIADANKVIESQHYKASVAIEMLMNPEEESTKKIIEQTNKFYGKIQEDLNGTTTQLTEKVNLALEDGVIDADEQKIISELQSKIAEITQKVSQAETDAKMEAIKIKFSAGELDYQSFQELQSEIQAQIESSTETYDTALETSITSLNLQLDEGAISEADYEEQLKALTEGYVADVGEIKANAEKVQLEILEGAFDIPTDQLQSAMQTSIADGIEPINWTPEQAAQYLNVDSLTEGMALALGQSLTGVSDSIPETSVSLNLTYTTDIDAKDAKIKEILEPNATYDGFKTEAKIQATYKPNKFQGTKQDFGIQDSYSASTTLNLTVNRKVTNVGDPLPGKDGNSFRGGIFYPKGFSDGGMVRGGSQLIEVAEEGSPEMIIPLSSQRRGRALKLWAQAGHMMRVPGFARGGLTGGGTDEGLRFQEYGAGSDSGGPQSVQVNVGGVTVEVQVSGNDTNIAESIRQQGSEIAETVAGILADAFNAQFANTPTKGGAY